MSEDVESIYARYKSEEDKRATILYVALFCNRGKQQFDLYIFKPNNGLDKKVQASEGIYLEDAVETRSSGTDAYV